MFFKLNKYYRGYIAFAILCPLFMILEVFGDVLIPSLMESTIDNGVMNQNIDLVIKNGKYMILVALLALFFGVVSTFFSAKAAQGFGANLRNDVFTKIQSFSFASLDQFEISSLITRLTNDIVFLSNLARMTLRIAVRAPVMFIMAIFMAIRINPKLSMIFAISLPIIAIGAFILMQVALPRFRKFQKSFDQVNNRTQENLMAIRVVKAFTREDYEVEKFEDKNNNLLVTSLHALNLIVLMMPLMMLVMFSIIISVFWFGGNLVLKGSMQAGELFSFTMYVGQILTSVINISAYVINLSRAKVSVERILEVLNTEPEFADDNTYQLKEVKKGNVCFKDVSFKYPNTKHRSLRDINLEIEAGSTTAIIGSTGSAKTTLVQLISRLYDVTSGEILIDNQPIDLYDPIALRDQVAMVLQENTLFSGTIRSNMQWGKEDATDEEIITALKISQAADFVLNRPEGLDSKVERGGANFSGGQKQRLCIARTLLKNPKIIIFDDSTSAVDMQTEANIREGLNKYNPSLTKIIIAQRISSIQHANRIIVLDNGEVSGIGTHEELLENNIIYREIYESQQRGMMAE